MARQLTRTEKDKTRHWKEMAREITRLQDTARGTKERLSLVAHFGELKIVSDDWFELPYHINGYGGTLISADPSGKLYPNIIPGREDRS